MLVKESLKSFRSSIGGKSDAMKSIMECVRVQFKQSIKGLKFFPVKYEYMNPKK